ncbi:MAG: hypothetical protein HY074_02600 [Deltaproteobacteria bacterium]|nr:hypothetical protein [Deltaproteobacteria bacterium]
MAATIRYRISGIFLLSCIFSLFAAGALQAQTTPLPSALPSELFAESAKTGAAPGDYSAQDFAIEWKGPSPGGVTATLAEDSLEWIRVAEVLVVPRGRLILTAKGLSSGMVSYAGFSTPIEVRGGNGRVEIPSDIASSIGNVWTLRLSSAANRVSLRVGTQSLVLRYSIPVVDHAGTIAIGVGPYAYTFEAEHTNTHTWAAIITAYGSYRLSDTMRIVGFDASAAHYNYYNDTGIYLSTVSAKAFDNRLLVNIMLGAHALVFRTDNVHYLRPGGPQGFELVYRDAFKRAYNLSLGAFIYPPISNRSYYNVWARWGGAGLFAELNFIAWREKGGSSDIQGVYNRSIGVSLGMPLFRFF